MLNTMTTEANQMTEAATMTSGYLTDAELVSRTLAGDRDAFNQIVSRYQILICSLAYSRIGQLGQSEDVAQETFITAWKHLRLLRQPEKLRAWLCGIVRNRARKCLRNEGREPVRDAEPLDEMEDLAAPGALPSDQTISKEEEAIMWRALAQIPELYREPLILFYREHQSIEHVAVELDLTEDAVKQRLSRGRKLLHEKVEAFLEKTLSRSKPTPAFANAVLAALPAGSKSAATIGIGAAGKGLATKSLLGAFLLPFIGIFTGFGAQWLLFKGGRQGPGRLRLIMTWVVVIGFSVIGQMAVRLAGRHFNWSEPVFFAAYAGFWWFFAMSMATWMIPMYWRVMTMPRDTQTQMEPPTPLNYAAIVAGTYLMMSWGIISLAWNENDHLGAITIVGLMTALGVWNFFRTRDARGVPVRNAYFVQLASSAALMIGILNVRIDLWLSHGYGMSVAELHDQLPVWMIPSLTLVLLVWSVFLWVVTKPKAAAASQAR
jgi:RNA polymerase sigma factor (sigma-70 family)